MHSQLVKTGYSSLVDLLRSRASRHPERVAFTFLQDGELDESHLTYGELDRSARDIAAHLQQRGWQGERALLMYPSGLEYIKAFFGCLYAGTIAVPVYPPRASRNMLRLESIVNDAQTGVAMTTAHYRGKMETSFADHPQMERMGWLTTDDLDGSASDSWVEPQLDPDSLAFLQYTSGSTSAPKGVMVTHGNLLHNTQMVQTAFGHQEGWIMGGWLPLYHDMGLIGLILEPLHLGGTSVLMTPMDFLQNPYRWLSALSRYKVQTSGAPNFAYDLCIRKITEEQKQTLDLSHLHILFNGAEPVRAETLQRFSDAFASCGFKKEAFYPCYGMAEATLFVAGGQDRAAPVAAAFDSPSLENHRVVAAEPGAEGARTLVGCGQVWSGQTIRIVDPETLLPCPPDRIGEIWLQGSSIASGYWNREELTRQTFDAYIAGSKEGPYLRTGDLGFLHEGELFVTGRCKDLIVLRGKNFYPSDFEFEVERSHPAIRESCSAAFSVEVGTEERLIVAAELERSFRPRKQEDDDALQEVKRIIRQRIMGEFQVQPYEILLLKTGSIPKTSSGKIQRHACKIGYLDKTLEAW